MVKGVFKALFGACSRLSLVYVIPGNMFNHPLDQNSMGFKCSKTCNIEVMSALQSTFQVVF